MDTTSRQMETTSRQIDTTPNEINRANYQMMAPNYQDPVQSDFQMQAEIRTWLEFKKWKHNFKTVEYEFRS